MRYYRVILIKDNGKILFSDITEHFMEKEQLESGNWSMPITRIVTHPNEYHFISFEEDYLKAFLAGISVREQFGV